MTLKYEPMKPFLMLCCVLFCTVSCDDIIEVPNISNEQVTVLAPTDNSTLNSNNVTFTWEPLEDAESYHVQVATPNFENAIQIVKDSTLTGTHFSMILDYDSYEWRIRAENAGYATAYTQQGFTIEE